MLSRREFVAASLGSTLGLRFPGVHLLGDATFDRLMAQANREHWRSLTVGEAAGRCGFALIGTPYVGSTLEIDDSRESCVVRLDALDCVTFYEIALAFSRMVHQGKGSLSALESAVTHIRYRHGKLDGYLSRLHYTSDWIADNAAKKVVRELTPELAGAVRMDKSFDFMSRHPESYRQLRAHPEWVSKMRALEQSITARRPWYVPNAGVEAIEPFLLTGDIVGIATHLDGLDCSHTGMVYVDEKGTRRFLNASSVQKQVVLGERLSEYANRYSRNLGVMIARPLALT